MKYNKELLNRFLTEKVAIALRTQEEWNEFMELLEEETDLGWGTEMKPTEFDGWEYCESRTSVTNDFNGDGLEYASCKFYEGKGYTVIEFKELAKEKEMNLADKLRFLADRLDDGKDFYIGNEKYSLNKGKLIMLRSGFKSTIEINDLINGLNLRLAPQWTFTEDEKVILRNLPEQYKWIARDEDGDVFVYIEKPAKNSEGWVADMGDTKSITFFNHIFQSIQWSDEEPCEFRKYL